MAGAEDELSLEVGEEVTVLRQGDDEGWFLGQIAGKNGIFPESYVEKCEEEPEEDKPEAVQKEIEAKKEMEEKKEDPAEKTEDLSKDETVSKPEEKSEDVAVKDPAPEEEKSSEEEEKSSEEDKSSATESEDEEDTETKALKKGNTNKEEMNDDDLK